jgi:chromosome partitioning protein
VLSICVANQKGGVGKTTTAVTLAHGLALKGYTTLLVDLDPQGQCASHLGLDQDDGVFRLLVNRPPMRDVVRTTGRDNLWILPGNKRSKTAEIILATELHGADWLGEIVGDRVNSHKLHYLILDTAPSAGGLQENALYLADVLIVPAAVDYLALEGVAEVLKTLRALGRPGSPVTRVLPTFYDEVTRESETNLDRLGDAFGDRVMQPIHRAVVLRECPAVGKSIFEHDPKSRAAKEYAQVVWEVLNAS